MSTTYPIDVLSPESNEVKLSGVLNFTSASNAPVPSAPPITSGTMPNLGAWVSGTAKVNPVSRQITTYVECVFDGTANAATVAIAVSADNTTFTTVGTPGVSVGVNTAGASTMVVPVVLPQGWYIKITIAAHATVAASIYY